MHSPNSSNSANSANQRPALQVVPPAALKPNLPPVSPTPTDSPKVTTETAPSPSTETSHSYANYLWFILVAIIGIGCLRFLPVGSSVSGEAKITSNAIKPYKAPKPGLVEIRVRNGDQVKPGDILARLKSDEHNDKIAEKNIQHSKVKSEIDYLKNKLIPLQESLKEAVVREQESHRKTEDLQNKLKQVNIQPQMQELQIQIAGINNDISRWQKKLKDVANRTERYQSFKQEGAISTNTLEDQQEKENDINRQIEEKKYQVEAKKAQMAGVIQNLQQDLQQKQAEEKQAATAVDYARSQINQALADVRSKEQEAAEIAKDVERVKNESKKLELRADKAGIVVTPNADLDQIQNQYVQATTEIVKTLDPKQLLFEVSIKPEDEHLVEKGQLVTFRPRGRGLLSYEGRVQSIPIVPPSKDTQQPSTVKVYVSINQGQKIEQLQPEFPGDAHIEVESMFLYQKLQREFDKLVPIGKFF